jgi:glycosyltransferase involved in cell wall biosynthesis
VALSQSGERRLTVLFVEDAITGGLYRYAQSLCAALTTAGESITLLTGLGYPNPGQMPFAVASLLKPMVLRSPRTPRILSRLSTATKLFVNAILRARVASSFNPDVVHIDHFFVGIDMIALRLLSGRYPVVLTAHDVIPHKNYLGVGGLTDFQWRSAFRAATAIIVHTHGMKDELIERYRIRGENIFVIPHGASILNRTKHNKLESRRRLRIPPKAHVISMIGNLRRDKGIDLFLESIKLVQSDEVAFMVAGHPADRQTAALIRDSMTDQRLHILNKWLSEEELADCYVASDVVVLPYRAFGSQSGILMQCYSFGCPVIVTSQIGLAENVRADDVGVVVDNEDSLGLARAMEWMLMHPEERILFGQRMIAAVESTYQWSEVAEGNRNVHEWAILQHGIGKKARSI